MEERSSSLRKGPWKEVVAEKRSLLPSPRCQGEVVIGQVRSHQLPYCAKCSYVLRDAKGERIDETRLGEVVLVNDGGGSLSTRDYLCDVSNISDHARLLVQSTYI